MLNASHFEIAFRFFYFHKVVQVECNYTNRFNYKKAGVI